MPGGDISDGEVSAPDIMTSASKAEQAEVDTLMAKKFTLYQQWEDVIDSGFNKHVGDLGKPIMKVVVQSFEGDAKSLGYNPVYKKLVDDVAQKTGKTSEEVVSEIKEGDPTSLSDPDNTSTLTSEEIKAIEDTEINQQAALENGIHCYLFAGEYATTQHNFNAIKTLKAISSQL